MKKLILITLFFFLVGSNINATIYYAATNGTNGNPGTLALPWSISFAFNTAAPGDTVYIKAGNYGAVNLVVQNGNTTFIGYTNFPGDLSWINQPDSLDTYLANNYTNIYPTINKNDRITGGWGIDFANWKSNVVVKNIQVLNYQYGVSVVGVNHTLENIIASGFGDVNVFYMGTGISTYGHKNKINHCFVLNGAAEGINAKGDSNLICNSKVYSNDTSTVNSLTDYYIYIGANSATKQGKYNKIDSCYIEKRGHQLAHVGHGGHGFCLTISYNHKPCAVGGGFCYDSTQKNMIVTDNVISNSTSKNIYECVMLRGDKVRNNYIENVTSLSYGGLVIQNSARNNTFNKCYIKNTYYWKDAVSSSILRLGAVQFFGSYYGDSTALNCPSPESNSFPWEQNLVGNHNTFTNCLFENVATAISLHSYAEYEYPAYHQLAGQATDRINRKRVVGNEFINCTFIGRADTVDILFEAMRGNAQNKLINCIVSGFKNYESRSFTSNITPVVVAKHGIIPTNFEYTNCLFYDNGFDPFVPANGSFPPLGQWPLVQGFSNNVAGTFSNCIVNMNPLFTNANSGDYSLSLLSPCIDSGIVVPINDDFIGNMRPIGNGFDIGAYESQGTAGIVSIKQEKRIVIFPNPSKDNITVLVKKSYISSDYSIKDVTGNEITKGKLKDANTIIDLNSFTSGIYFLQIKSNNGVESEKFIKQ